MRELESSHDDSTKGWGGAMARLQPSLDGFSDILELILGRHGQEEGWQGHSTNWIRTSIVAVGTKPRALKFIFEHTFGVARPRLLAGGSQIGSLPIYAARFGLAAAAVDNAHFADCCARAARDCGVDYRFADVGNGPLPFAGRSFDVVTYVNVVKKHDYLAGQVPENNQ